MTGYILLNKTGLTFAKSFQVLNKLKFRREILISTPALEQEVLKWAVLVPRNFALKE